MIVFVTGVSSGIGLWTAIEYLKKGFTVIGTVRKSSDLTSLWSESSRTLPRTGRQQETTQGVLRATDYEGFFLVTLDVTSSEEVSDVCAAVLDRFGKIDIIVNNAGMGCIGFFDETPEELFNQIIHTNFTGPASVIRNFLPSMIKRNRGMIINISSPAGSVGLPLSTGYSSSKFALEGFTQALSRELKYTNIHVTLVRPGITQTSMFSRNQHIVQSKIAERNVTIQKLLEYLNNGFRLHSMSPMKVANKIVSISLKQTVRSKYSVGRDAKLWTMLNRFCPENVFNSILFPFLR